MTHAERIIILDFGSQYTQLIARKVREVGVYAEIHPYSIGQIELAALHPKGIILSGGPSSVYSDDAPLPEFDVFDLGVPVLGICYGLQLVAYQLGGVVDKAARREFGRATLVVDDTSDLLHGLSPTSQVWMSHGDHITKIPPGFERIAHTENADICAIRNVERKIWGVQFHPEVHHSNEGKTYDCGQWRSECCVDGT